MQHCTCPALPEPLLKRCELLARRLIQLWLESTAEPVGTWQGAGRQTRVATAAVTAALAAGALGVAEAAVHPAGASHDRAKVIVGTYRPVTCRQTTNCQ